MVIQTNVAALMSYRESAKTNRAMKKTLEKLSSGYRINRSADDASGLAVSERMRIYCTEYGRCHTNAKEGLNLAKTADGALAEVNDMLRRARELCIQAENGTYSEQELASISDEMNELFGEIDRITEGSFFNEIQLFRGEKGVDFHYEYDETFTPVEGGGQETWGEMDFVESKPFDPPESAVPATITFTLDSDIDPNDPKTLNGCTIRIRSGYSYYDTYCFTDGTSPLPSGTYAINLSSISSVQQAVQRVADLSGMNLKQFDPASRTVTLESSLRTLSYNVNGLGFSEPNGDGTWANGRYTLSSVAGSSSLNQVDGQNATNNQPVYADTVYGAFNLSHLNRTLTPDDIKNLQGNTLSVGGNTIALKDIVRNGMTGDQLGSALATKISGFSNLTATYDNNTHVLSINYVNRPSNYPSSLTVSEGITHTIPGNPPTYKDVDGPSWTSSGISFTVNQTQTPSQERPEVCEVTIPSIPSGPFSFKVGNSTYLYYNSDNNKLTVGEYDRTRYSTSATLVDTKGKTQDQLVEDIAKKIQNNLYGCGVVVNGNKLTVTGTNANVSMGLASKFNPTQVTVTSYKKVPDKPGTADIPGTRQVLYPNYYYSYKQEVKIPFTLPGEANIQDLVGSGFSISGKKVEFVNGSGTGKSGEYTDIDISGCTSYDDLKTAIQTAFASPTYTVTIDQDKLQIGFKVNGSSIYVTDGLVGTRSLMEENSVTASGGTNIGHSQTEIDFSSINSGNLNDLLGKGFRITCATCPGEFINVFFCWENNGRAPESFKVDADTGQRLPDDTPVSDKVREIHNIAVELSKVTSGDQIVQSIVDQVRPTLKHFTDVDVGSSSTTLLAQDKRLGTYIGQVISGLETNFTYSVNIRKVEDYPEDGSVVDKENIVDIYVGSEPNPQIIPIHLPYIDLKTLRLRPPETVDLNDAEQDASDWLNRVDQANLFISKSRGVIGADHNRLESAVQALSHAKENITDAESRIRDTDMAEEMMEHIKLQILTQSQQSMLSQAMARPQQVLQLIS